MKLLRSIRGLMAAGVGHILVLTAVGLLFGMSHVASAALIGVDSELDRVALSRGASLYTPDRKIPMLPPALSEGLGSLVPGEDRLAVSVLFDVNARGERKAPSS